MIFARAWRVPDHARLDVRLSGYIIPGTTLSILKGRSLVFLV